MTWQYIEKKVEELEKRIAALEQGPCDDAISRQAVLDDLEKSHITSGVRNQGTWNECIDSMMRTIKDMPSVQTKAGWIPTSEKMPPENETVLCSVHKNISTEKIPKIILDHYRGQLYWLDGRIEAWMPLPEPYKGDDE